MRLQYLCRLSRHVGVERRQDERLRPDNDDGEKHRQDEQLQAEARVLAPPKHRRRRGEDVDEVFPERRLGRAGVFAGSVTGWLRRKIECNYDSHEYVVSPVPVSRFDLEHAAIVSRSSPKPRTTLVRRVLAVLLCSLARARSRRRCPRPNTPRGATRSRPQCPTECSSRSAGTSPQRIISASIPRHRSIYLTGITEPEAVLVIVKHAGRHRHDALRAAARSGARGVDGHAAWREGMTRVTGIRRAHARPASPRARFPARRTAARYPWSATSAARAIETRDEQLVASLEHDAPGHHDDRCERDLVDRLRMRHSSRRARARAQGDRHHRARRARGDRDDSARHERVRDPGAHRVHLSAQRRGPAVVLDDRRIGAELHRAALQRERPLHARGRRGRDGHRRIVSRVRGGRDAHGARERHVHAGAARDLRGRARRTARGRGGGAASVCRSRRWTRRRIARSPMGSRGSASSTRRTRCTIREARDAAAALRRGCAQLSLYYIHALGHGDRARGPRSNIARRRAGQRRSRSSPASTCARRCSTSCPTRRRIAALIARLRPVVKRYANIGMRIEDDYFVTPSGVEWISRGAARGQRDRADDAHPCCGARAPRLRHRRLVSADRAAHRA